MRFEFSTFVIIIYVSILLQYALYCHWKTEKMVNFGANDIPVPYVSKETGKKDIEMRQTL